MFTTTILIAISCTVFSLISGLYVGYRVASRVYLREVIENIILHAVNETLLEQGDTQDIHIEVKGTTKKQSAKRK